jgi:diaminopimelate decarboxylase
MTAIGIGDGRIAGLQAEGLAAAFGTPLYVYDLDAVAARVAGLRAALPPTFELAYAAKANPALAVLALMAELGLGLDIASGGELHAASRAGIAPGRIVFTGPGKRDTELAAAVAAGLRAVTVESAGELARLERAAADVGRVVPILLRMAVDGGEEATPILGRGWHKFGIDPSELESVARRTCASPWLDVLGLHAFGASNVTDADAIAAHVARTVDAAVALARRVGFALRLVDVGGGLGVPYRDCQSPLDLDRLGQRLAVLGVGWAADSDLAELPVLLEPGRYLTAPCGLLLARVLDRKRVGGQDVAVIDAGIHHALRPVLVGDGHRLRLVCAGQRPAVTGDPVLVAGPLCTGLDVFPGGIDAVPEPGDLVAVCDLGAYGFSQAMPAFLSHPNPAEVAIRGGRAELIRLRVEPDELLAGQRLPSWA